jgi:hypothetical protein
MGMSRLYCEHHRIYDCLCSNTKLSVDHLPESHWVSVAPDTISAQSIYDPSVPPGTGKVVLPQQKVVLPQQKVVLPQQKVEPGTKFDSGKPMWELLPYDAIEEAVKILTSGANKYGSRNWEKGIPYGRIFGALMRHLNSWWMSKVFGTDGKDPESGRSHLSHALCELLFLIAYECRKMVNFDDRPVSPN